MDSTIDAKRRDRPNQTPSKRKKLSVMAAKTLVVLLAVLTVCSSVNVDSMLHSTIVESLVHHFHCGCAVFFRHGNGKAEEERLGVLQKELSMRQIVTAVMHLMELSVSEEWSRCRPVRALAVIPGDSKTIAKFLKQISHVLQKSNGIWLILLGTGSVDEAMQGVVTGLECEVLVAEVQGDSVIFTEVYVVNPNYVHKTHFGSWTPEKGLEILPLQGFYERRSDLYGVTIKVSAINKPPLSDTKLNEKGVLVFDENSFHGQVWKVIQDKLNITTEIVLARDNAIGSISNGSWSGIIAMLAENEVDVGVSDFVMSTTRLGVLEFSEPLYHTSLALFVNPRDVRQVNWDSFLEPYSPRLWFAVLGAILVLTISINVFYKIGGDEKEYRFVDLLLYMHGIFCQQGMDKTPERTSFRALILTAYITSIMILSSYSAALISSLSSRKIELPFSSLYDLLRLGDFRLGIIVNGWVYNQLTTSADPKIGKVLDALVEPYLDEMPKSVVEGLEWVCDPDLLYGFYGTIQDVVTVLTKVNCTPVAVSGDRSRVFVALGLKRNNVYRGIINHSLKEMRRSGILKRLMKNSFQMKMPEAKSMMERLDIWDVTPLMAILAVGTFIGTVVLFVERTARKLMQKKLLKRRLLPRRHFIAGPANSWLRDVSRRFSPKPLRILALERQGGELWY